MKFKIGEKVVCCKDLYMSNDEISFKLGRFYLVVDISAEGYIELVDEQGDNHGIGIVGNDDTDWCDYFKDVRLEKMKRILEE